MLVEPFSQSEQLPPVSDERSLSRSLSVAEITILPSVTLVFVQRNEPIDAKYHANQCEHLFWLIDRTYSAEHGSEWFIPNGVLTNVDGYLYIPVINPSRQPATFHVGKQVVVAENARQMTLPMFTTFSRRNMVTSGFAIDYRGVNAITVRGVFHLPRIDDFLDHLGKAKVFANLDLKSGSWQIPVDEAYQAKTAFTTPAQLATYFPIHYLVVTWHWIRSRLFWSLYGIDLVVMRSAYCGQFAPNGC